MEPQRKRGKRGSGNSRATAARHRDIHSKLDGMPANTHRNHALAQGGSSQAQMIAERAIYFECSEMEEKPEDYVIPRQSLTRQKLLGLFPQQIEVEPIKGRQLDHSKIKTPILTVADAERHMVSVEDNRLVWASDKTLLYRDKPTDNIGTFKREGYIADGLNKRTERRIEPEPKAIPTVAPADDQNPDPIESQRVELDTDLDLGFTV
jgi:hypothetical protein